MIQDSLHSGTFPLCRVAGIDVKIHWTLLAVALFQTLTILQGSAPLWIALLIPVIVFLSILLHEFGHSLTARLVGGDSRTIIMWAFGGLAECIVPMNWAKRFFVVAAGPAVTFIIMAVCGMFTRPYFNGPLDFGFAPHNSLVSLVCMITAELNLTLLLFNLIPATPLDGGGMLRALLWPVIGLQRAVIATIYTAYVLLTCLGLFALTSGSIFLLILVGLLVYSVYQEHQAYKQGYMVYGGISKADNHWQGGEESWLKKKGKEMAAKKSAREAAKADADQERVDALLEKVSSEGLPSLTNAERKFLQQHSENERKKRGI